MAARQTDLRLYLDVVADPPAKGDVPQGYIMLFLKHFDAGKQTLLGAGRTYVSRASKVGDLAAHVNERMRWAPGTPLKLYEEIKPGMIELMKPKLTFTQSEIQDGDIICFQVDLPEKECVPAGRGRACVGGADGAHRAYDLEAEGKYSSPIQYYEFIQNRVKIQFRPKYEEVDATNPEFELTLSKKQNYDTVRSGGACMLQGCGALTCARHRCPPRSASTCGTTRSSSGSRRRRRRRAARSRCSSAR
jgi:ubiquitin carboxyl-terminal hydrolase 7